MLFAFTTAATTRPPLGGHAFSHHAGLAAAMQTLIHHAVSHTETDTGSQL